MQLSDFFSFKDLVRTALIGSALFLLVGSLYGIFLHAQYSSGIDGVKQDLTAISALMGVKSREAYKAGEGAISRDYKTTADKAKELSKKIEAPPVTPSAYTYMNYWIASAAFTELRLSPDVLGVPNSTIESFQELDNGRVLGSAGWWKRVEFKGYSIEKGEFVQYLEGPPGIESHFWTFYLFVFIISVFSIFIGVKDKYEFPVLPELIYGAFMPVLFFVVFTLSGVLSLTGIVRFLHPTQVNVMVSLLAFVIMAVISAFGALIAALMRIKFKRVEV